MKQFFFSLLILFAISLHGQSVYAPTDSIPMDSTIREGLLPNGMHYFIQQNHKPEDRAELRLAIKAGSLQEDENQLGLAHFVEHMAFNGTEHFAKNELVDYLESVGTRFGADLNAYTSFAETVYMLQARTDSLPLLEKGLLIMEDWAGGLTFDSLEVEKERGVVISEWRTSLSPDQRLQQQYFPVLYNDSRYAERLPIGDPEIIKTASVQTIRKFYQDWYRPDLMAIIAVGDFDLNWMESEIKRRFSRLTMPETPREREEYQIPAHEETLYTIATDKEAPFTNVRVLYKHPAKELKTINDYQASLTRSLYNSMLNARLVEVQQQADPPFTFAYSGYGSDLGDLDIYHTYAFVRSGGALRGIETVLTETQRAQQHGFVATELERKKKELLRSAEQAYEERDKMTSGGLAARLVYHYLEDIPIPSPEQRLKLYQQLLPKIQLADINPLPKQWIRDSNRVVIVTGPEDQKAQLPTEEELSQLFTQVAEQELPPYQDEVSDEPLITKELKPGTITSEKTIDSLGVQEWTLSNGVKMVIKSTEFQNNEVLMTAFSPGGHSVYNDEKYYSASHAAPIIDQAGLGNFDLVALQKKLSGKLVNVGPYIGELYEGFSGSSTPEDLETLFQLVYLYFTQPRIDTAGFQSYIKRQESIFENIMANPYNSFADIKNHIKYNGHPRRQITTMQDLEKISPENVLSTYQDRFADASDFTFFFVGNFEADGLRQLAKKYLANLPTTNREETWKDIHGDLIEGTMDTTFYKGEAPKALVELIYHGNFDPEKDNRYAFSTLSSLLRIKLRESMREDLGGVYGVRLSGNLSYYPTPDYRITLSFNCEPDQVDTLIQTAKATIDELKTDGPEAKDLQKVAETQRQNRIKGLQENNYWLGQLSYRYQYGLPLEGIQLKALDEKINTLTPEMIQEATKRYFSGENYLQFVLMPEANKGN